MVPINTNVGPLNCDQLPNDCPVCHTKIEPLDWGQGHLHGSTVDKIFLCPSRSCKRLFIARYKATRQPNGVLYVLFELHPLTLVTSGFSETIIDVSTEFTVIFSEAEIAEKHGLKLICGPGYRKALEFLIKDYAILLNPNDAKKIISSNLGKCITDYVSDPKIKEVASRAVWLGNDETHYERKWDDKDLTDLKRLIALTVHWIEMDELTREALKSMPEGKP